MNAIKNFLRPTKVTWRMFTIFSIILGTILYLIGNLGILPFKAIVKILGFEFIVGDCMTTLVIGSANTIYCNMSVGGFIIVYLILLVYVYIFASAINYLSIKVSKK